MTKKLPHFQNYPGSNLRQKNSPERELGFTLVELLVAAAIISIVGIVLIAAISSFLRVSLLSQDIVRAQNLANEKIEILKNMPYDELATEFGPIYPPGTVLDVENVTSGGQEYVVRTYISFVDDPFDGNALGTIVGKPVDFYPFDYKKATIEVRDLRDDKTIVKISTNISANAAETSDDTGILFLAVVDSEGNPVPNANVHLTNTNVSPAVDITTITDIEGLLQIPLLPEDTTNSYHIEISLPGYSTDRTYPDNIVGYDPVDPDFNILAQQVTSVTMTIDRLADMNITVQDETGSPRASFDLTVASEDLIYVDTTEVNPNIPKYEEDHTTNASGEITLTDIEWGSYHFAPPSGFYVVSVTPYEPFTLAADSSLNVIVKISSDPTWPQIASVTPSGGLNNTSVNVEVLGANLPSGTNLELRRSGQPTIVATGVVSGDSDTRLSGTFNLSGALVGAWDVVVSFGGKTTIQTGGFAISSP